MAKSCAFFKSSGQELSESVVKVSGNSKFTRLDVREQWPLTPVFFSAHWFLINQKSLASVWSELLYIPSFVLWIGIEIRYNVVGISGILFGCLLPNDGIGSLKLDFYVQKSMKEICWIILIFLPYVCYSWWFYGFFKVEKLPKIGIRYFEDLVHPHVPIHL